MVQQQILTMMASAHRTLHAVGRTLGMVLGFALFLVLHATALLALILGSLFAGIQISTFLGGGVLLGVALFWCFVGLAGYYVGPYIIPQIRKAALALLDEPQKAPRAGDPEPGT